MVYQVQQDGVCRYTSDSKGDAKIDAVWLYAKAKGLSTVKVVKIGKKGPKVVFEIEGIL